MTSPLGRTTSRIRHRGDLPNSPFLELSETGELFDMGGFIFRSVATMNQLAAFQPCYARPQSGDSTERRLYWLG
jgi:hypothetical protein